MLKMNNLTIGEFKNIFENYLQEYLSSLQEFYPLTDSFKYSILNGGKRIRPYLVYLGACHPIESLPLSCEINYFVKYMHSFNVSSLTEGRSLTFVSYY